MSRNTPKSLSELIFRPGSPVEQLARQAEAAVDLAGALRAALPATLAPGLRSAALRADGTLVVLALSSAWAARLRFEAEALLGQCRERYPATQRVEVRVGGSD
jgi:hypothetical protein